MLFINIHERSENVYFNIFELVMMDRMHHFVWNVHDIMYSSQIPVYMLQSEQIQIKIQI